MREPVDATSIVIETFCNCGCRHFVRFKAGERKWAKSRYHKLCRAAAKADIRKEAA